jgi:hypothetical protein
VRAYVSTFGVPPSPALLLLPSVAPSVLPVPLPLLLPLPVLLLLLSLPLDNPNRSSRKSVSPKQKPACFQMAYSWLAYFQLAHFSRVGQQCIRVAHDAVNIVLFKYTKIA